MFKGLGGMGDMMGLMKQAQKLKKEMKNIKKDISKTNITVCDSNNNLKIIINGDNIIQKISFSEDYDLSNKKLVESLLMDTLNKASKEVEKMTTEKMSALSKQGIPTDLPF